MTQEHEARICAWLPVHLRLWWIRGSINRCCMTAARRLDGRQVQQGVARPFEFEHGQNAAPCLQGSASLLCHVALVYRIPFPRLAKALFHGRVGFKGARHERQHVEHERAVELLDASLRENALLLHDRTEVA